MHGGRGCLRRRHDPHERIGDDGTIVTGASPDRIPREFLPVLEAAVEHVTSRGGDVSLYVYGSVATGMARIGGSDVDLITLGLAAADADRLAGELSAAFSGRCRSVDIGPAQPSDHEGPGDEAYGNRVFLRHYAVHLAGPRFGQSLPRFAADRAAARGFNGDIGLCASRWRAELAELGEADSGRLGRRVARKTLFAVTGLVSVHDAVWTTDRLAAARRWSVIRPRLAAPLATLVDWAERWPPAQVPRREIQAVLDGVVADVIEDFRDHIGLWAPPAPHAVRGPRPPGALARHADACALDPVPSPSPATRG